MYDNNLYQFIGADQKNTDIGIYEITHKLGLRNEKNQYLYEYSKTEGNKSFIESNNVNTILKAEEVIEESTFEVVEDIKEDDIVTFEGEIYDSKDEDNLETEIEC